MRICVFKAIGISLCSTLNNCLYKSNCTTKRSNRVSQQKLDFPRDYISLMSDFSSVDSHNFNAKLTICYHLYLEYFFTYFAGFFSFLFSGKAGVQWYE